MLPMNHQFYPYYQQVIPFIQGGDGDISVMGERILMVKDVME